MALISSSMPLRESETTPEESSHQALVTTGGGALDFLVYYLLDLFLQRWNIFLNGLPNRIDINTMIFMNQLVPHPRHLSPWDFWVSRSDVFRHFPGSLSDNFYAPQNSIDCLLVPGKPLKGHAFSKISDITYGVAISFMESIIL